MYKIATDLAQRRARQLWLADLQGNAFEELPLIEQRASLVRAKNQVTADLVKLPKGSAERKRLGKLATEFDQRIHAIRPKLKGGKCTAEMFIEVAREQLHPLVFSKIMGEASQRAKVLDELQKAEA